MLNHELAGGALLDIGVYNVGVTQWVLRSNSRNGSPPRLTWARPGWMSRPSPTWGTLTGWSRSSPARYAPATQNDLWIYRTHGLGFASTPISGAARTPALRPTSQELTVHEPWRATGFEYQIEAASESIRAGEIENPGMHTATLENLAIMDRIQRAGGAGVFV